MATSVPHALTLTEVFNAFNATERAAFNTWPLANAFCHAVMTRNLDAVAALANFAKAANINIIGNADANAIIALAQQLDTQADPVASGKYTYAQPVLSSDKLVLSATVVFTGVADNHTETFTFTGAVSKADLKSRILNYMAQLDARDAAAADIATGV